MSDTTTFGYPEAARRFGVPIRVLRNAIRSGRLPAPPRDGATASLPAEWLTQVQASISKSPKALNRSTRQKVPAFARYEGTSAWRKYASRVRDYARFQATGT